MDPQPTRPTRPTSPTPPTPEERTRMLEDIRRRTKYGLIPLKKEEVVFLLEEIDRLTNDLLHARALLFGVHEEEA